MKRLFTLLLVLGIAIPCYAANSTTYTYRFNPHTGKLDAVILSADAQIVTPDTSNFGGILSAADNTVQKALDTIDDAGGGVSSVNEGTAGPLELDPTTGAVLISIASADATHDGYIKKEDFATFLNDRVSTDAILNTLQVYGGPIYIMSDGTVSVDALSVDGDLIAPIIDIMSADINALSTGVTSVSEGTAGPLVIDPTTGAVLVSIASADATTDGYVKQADFNTWTNDRVSDDACLNSLTVRTYPIQIYSDGRISVDSISVDNRASVGTLNIRDCYDLPSVAPTVNGAVISYDSASGTLVWGTVPGSGTVTSVNEGVAGPLEIIDNTTAPQVSIASADVSTDGYIKQADFATFMNDRVSKDAALVNVTFDTACKTFFEGATTDTFRIHLDVIDPTQSRSILLPDLDGTVLVAAREGVAGPLVVETLVSGETVISIQSADAATDGYITSTNYNDWQNNRVSGDYVESVVEGVTGPLEIVPTSGHGAVKVSIQSADASTAGYISSTNYNDWQNNRVSQDAILNSIQVYGWPILITSDGTVSVDALSVDNDLIAPVIDIISKDAIDWEYNRCSGDTAKIDTLSCDTLRLNTYLFPTDTPGDNEVIMYDAALGRLNYEAGGSAVAGTPIQTVWKMSSDRITVMHQIPYDDTIPQATEGLAIIANSITPTASGNKIYIHATIVFSDADATVAVFSGDSANAIAAVYADGTSGNTLDLQAYINVHDTNAKTFTIRAGNNAPTEFYVNGVSGPLRKFGGSAGTVLLLQEIQG